MFTDRRANTRKTKRERQPKPAGRSLKILALGGRIKGSEPSNETATIKLDAFVFRPRSRLTSS